MVIKKPDDIFSSQITDEHLFLTRRNFVRAAVLAGTTTATALLYRRFAIPAPVPAQVAANIEGVKSAPASDAIPPPPSDARTPYEKITNYNNYYEFTTDKEGVADVARNFTTRPWTVDKTYRRAVSDKPVWWREDVCSENNVHVGIGTESYYLSADGYLMPTKKGQAAPDLRYFKQK